MLLQQEALMTPVAQVRFQHTQHAVVAKRMLRQLAKIPGRGLPITITMNITIIIAITITIAIAIAITITFTITMARGLCVL